MEEEEEEATLLPHLSLVFSFTIHRLYLISSFFPYTPMHNKTASWLAAFLATLTTAAGPGEQGESIVKTLSRLQERERDRDRHPSFHDLEPLLLLQTIFPRSSSAASLRLLPQFSSRRRYLYSSPSASNNPEASLLTLWIFTTDSAPLSLFYQDWKRRQYSLVIHSQLGSEIRR